MEWLSTLVSLLNIVNSGSWKQRWGRPQSKSCSEKSKSASVYWQTSKPLPYLLNESVFHQQLCCYWLINCIFSSLQWAACQMSMVTPGSPQLGPETRAATKIWTNTAPVPDKHPSPIRHLPCFKADEPSTSMGESSLSPNSVFPHPRYVSADFCVWYHSVYRDETNK